MKELLKAVENKRKILIGIGILEIVGGITGIGFISWLIFQGVQTNTIVFLIMTIAFGFYTFSIIAGLILFQKQERGMLPSFILWFLQVFSFSFGGFSYLLTSGGNFFLGFNSSTDSFEFKFSFLASEFQINFSHPNLDTFFLINVWAIFFLFYINKLRKEIIENKENYSRYEEEMKAFANNI